MGYQCAPLILVWAKNAQPSNMSDMDGRASTIYKHAPKGNISLLGQTRYYAPEETNCLFQWADPLTTVTYSLSPAAPVPSTRHQHVLFLSLCIFLFLSLFLSLYIVIFYLLHGFMLICICRSFTYSPPRFFTTSHTLHTYQPYNPLPSLLLCRVAKNRYS